jgi:phospholipid transport system substrate-binding protein
METRRVALPPAPASGVQQAGFPMTTPIRSLALAAAFLMLVLVARPAAAQQDTVAAQQFMRSLGEEVIRVISDDRTMSEMVSELDRLFRRHFDTDTIGRFVLGRYWNVATPEQRETYLGLFQEYIVQTYARRFTEYSNEEFVVQGARPEGERDVMVDSSIIRQQAGAPPVDVDWRLRQRDGQFQIVDVVIEGVSMALTYRDEFRTIIERNGGRVEALLTELRNAIDRAQGPLGEGQGSGGQ